MNRERLRFLTTERGALVASATEIRELATYTLGLLSRIEQELDRHSNAIRAGMGRARAQGRHIGRPRVEVDVERAASLWSRGLSLKAIAREMDVDRNTLRRRLHEAGFDTDPRDFDATERLTR